MSVLMKKPLTNITIDGMLFYVSKEHKKAITTIVSEMSVSDENPFVEIEARLPSYSICLRGARHKEGFSQKEVSKRTGIAITNLSKMENGQRKIGEKLAKKLAKIYKVDYRTLMG